MTSTRYVYPASFALACAAVLAAAVWVAALLPQATHPAAIATGMTVDLVVLLPALYYGLLVRGRGWPAVGTVLVFLAGVGVAGWIVPPAHQQLLHVIGWAAPAAELLVAGYVLVKASNAIRRRLHAPADEAGDLVERWRTATSGAFPVRAVAEAVAYEAATWQYLWQGLRRTGRPAQNAPGAFSYHSSYGPVVAIILFVAAVETVGVHVLIYVLWSPAWAWVHFALSAYGFCWLTADYCAAGRRPHHIGQDALTVRLGLRWTAHVPFEKIASVQETRRASEGPEGTMTLALVGGARVLVTLTAPITVRGPYGLTRHAEALHLAVDAPERFAVCLREQLKDGKHLQG